MSSVIHGGRQHEPGRMGRIEVPVNWHRDQPILPQRARHNSKQWPPCCFQFLVSLLLGRVVIEVFPFGNGTLSTRFVTTPCKASLNFKTYGNSSIKWKAKQSNMLSFIVDPCTRVVRRRPVMRIVARPSLSVISLASYFF